MWPVVGALTLALLAIAGMVVLSSKLEREVLHPLAEDVRHTILNPGTVVLAVVLAVLIFSRGRRS